MGTPEPAVLNKFKKYVSCSHVQAFVGISFALAKQKFEMFSYFMKIDSEYQTIVYISFKFVEN